MAVRESDTGRSFTGQAVKDRSVTDQTSSTSQ